MTVVILAAREGIELKRAKDHKYTYDSNIVHVTVQTVAIVASSYRF